MHSAIYTGEVWHRRLTPRRHQFSYRVYMAYLDLDELDQVMATSSLWGYGPGQPVSAEDESSERDKSDKPDKKNHSPLAKFWPPVQFRRQDFFRDFDLPLDIAIRQWVYRQTGETVDGPIRMLANLRTFGFIINPIVCYYLFDKTGKQLRYVIAEVTNTPWQERIQYLLPVDEQGRLSDYRFAKGMHVSPFNDMAMDYVWSSNLPAADLHIDIENQRRGETVFQASMQLQRRELSRQQLQTVCLRFPFMSLKVAAAIHWQALKLWLKKVPLVPHPKSIERNG